MAEKLAVYKCRLCGNVVEVLDGGEGELVCCGQPMEMLTEQTEDASREKHVPHIEAVAGGVKVRVGLNAAHPMTEQHWIQWIELLADGRAYRQFLRPGDEPEAFFPVSAEGATAREMCNVHGLWKG
ncbi:MAG: desulfoferrodoxin [Planctomycetes bacterium]|nr:desulfoferrodoxin [Planctomycetota bacterium]